MAGKEYQAFPVSVKRQVKQEQQYRCLICNGLCRGHGYSEPPLETHHIIPQSRGGACTRENACGLCPACHQEHDTLYFKEGKTVFEVLLEEGRWADLSQHPGNPYTRQRNQVGD